MHDNRTQQLVYVRKGSCQVRGGDFDTLDGNKVERRYVHTYYMHYENEFSKNVLFFS